MLFPYADNAIISLATSFVTMTTQSSNVFTTSHHGFLADITLNPWLVSGRHHTQPMTFKTHNYQRQRLTEKWECPICVTKWETEAYICCRDKISQFFYIWQLNTKSSDEQGITKYPLFIYYNSCLVSHLCLKTFILTCIFTFYHLLFHCSFPVDFSIAALLPLFVAIEIHYLHLCLV